MTTLDALARLRHADPARESSVPWTADDLLTVLRADDVDHVDEAGPAGPRHRRGSTSVPRRRRWATVAAAAALLLSSPVWWPGSLSPSSTALAVTRDGDAVHVTVPRPVDAQELQTALDEAGVRATVVESSAECTATFPDGLREGYDVAPPEQNLAGPDDAATFHFTFYPDRMPAGTTVLFAVEPESTGLLVVEQVPVCLPLTVRTSATG